MPGLLRRTRGASTRYYFQHRDGYQQPLGEDYDSAVAQWKALFKNPTSAAKDAFISIADEFEKHGMMGLKPKTQREYIASLTRLKKVFKESPLRDIRPMHVGQLLHAGRDTPYQVNRDKATLSRMWNWARSRGRTDLPNPCIGIDGHHEPGRNVIVSDDMFWAIYDRADQVLRDWMRLDIVIGQRVTDITLIKSVEVVKDAGGGRALRYQSAKTGTLGLMSVEHDLEMLIDEMTKRKRAATGPYLLQTDAGQRITYAMLRNRFETARGKAIKEMGEAFTNWRMQDLRKTNINQAKTLEEGRRRALHTDPRTTARHYEVRVDSLPGAIPKRTEEDASSINGRVITDKAS